MTMNRNGKGPNLTWMVLGVIAFVGVFALIYAPDYGIYTQIMNINGVPIDPAFAGNASAIIGKQASLDTFKQNFTFSSTWAAFSDIPGAVVSTLNIGLGAVRLFSSLPTMLTGIIDILQTVLHIPSIFMWMLITGITIYGMSKLIKALRGTIEEA